MIRHTIINVFVLRKTLPSPSFRHTPHNDLQSPPPLSQIPSYSSSGLYDPLPLCDQARCRLHNPDPLKNPPWKQDSTRSLLEQSSPDQSQSGPRQGAVETTRHQSRPGCTSSRSEGLEGVAQRGSGPFTSHTLHVSVPRVWSPLWTLEQPLR